MNINPLGYMSALVACVIVAILVATHCTESQPHDAPPGDGGRPVFCESDDQPETISSLSPGGDWWGRADGLLVRARLHWGRGHVAVWRNGESFLFEMQVYYPDGLIDARRIYYHVSSAEHYADWHGKIPAFERWRPGIPISLGEGERADKIEIKYIYGTFGADLEPFTLYLLSGYDPVERCTDSELQVLAQLGLSLPRESE